MTSDKIIQEALELLRDNIIKRSTEAGQKASGETYKTLTIENISLTHGELHGASWIGVWEDGRKAGKIPRGFAEIIKEWAEYKGITFPDPIQFERWATAVAWKIKLYGTAHYRDGRKLDIFKVSVKEFEKYMTERISDYYKTMVVNEIKTAFKK